MRLVAMSFLFWLVLSLPAYANTLLAQCNERIKNVTLTGSDTAEAGRIWNVDRNGTKKWAYEGTDYTVKLGDSYTSNFELSLNRFGCSNHYNFYYTDAAGDHAVTAFYVERIATLLETAWTELTQNQGFRSPVSLKADLRYSPITDFQRVPVLIFTTIDGKNHGNGTPMISINPGLSASSRSPHHELFHVIKHGYTTFNPGWLNEGMARWSEKLVAGGGEPCGSLASYEPLTFNLLERDYCYSARFWDYLAMKYGTLEGADVVRTVLEEMAAVHSNHDAMLAVERALDRFRARSSGYGNAYKEWAKGNWVDDTDPAAVARSGIPARPRWKEAGEIGTGGHQYVWHDFTFSTRSRGTITIAVRAAAGDIDGDGDDDDLRFRLDGTLLGDWNSENAFDGAVLRGQVRTIHIVRRDVASGNHTLRLEADEHPALLSLNVFSGEVPLLRQDSALFKWCQSPPIALHRGLIPCFSDDVDPPMLSRSFNLPNGNSQATVILEGRASSGEQNLAAGFVENDDDVRVLIDGVAMSSYNTDQSLDGDYLEAGLAATEVRTGLMSAGDHTIELRTVGKPYVDHVAVYPTPQFLPLFSLVGGNLTSWSTNYHVIRVGAELLPSNADVLVPNNLTINLGTYTWQNEFEPPFYYVLLIDSSRNLIQTLTGPDSHSVSRSITPETLNRLGVGGSVVVVVGTRDASGTYYVRVKR